MHRCLAVFTGGLNAVLVLGNEESGYLCISTAICIVQWGKPLWSNSNWGTILGEELEGSLEVTACGVYTSEIC